MALDDRTLHVLVVDDDEDIRTSLAELLADEGFEVDLADDGLDALSLLDRRASVDVIVCDLDMPRLDGTGLVRTLRRRGRRCVVVILSGRFDLLATTGDLGEVYALAKPIDANRLVATLRQAVGTRS